MAKKTVGRKEQQAKAPAAKGKAKVKAKARPKAKAPARFDPGIFAPLSEGERADASRVLLEDERLRQTAKVGRYRVISVEVHAEKPADAAPRRLARLVIYDHAQSRAIDGLVDLARGRVVDLVVNQAQPVLAEEEEEEAARLALADERVHTQAGEADQVAVFPYAEPDLASPAAGHRQAAVVLGGDDGAALVAVVDLVLGRVTDVIPAGSF